MWERSQSTRTALERWCQGELLAPFLLQGIFFLAADEGLWDVPCGTARGFIGL